MGEVAGRCAWPLAGGSANFRFRSVAPNGGPRPREAGGVIVREAGKRRGSHAGRAFSAPCRARSLGGGTDTGNRAMRLKPCGRHRCPSAVTGRLRAAPVAKPGLLLSRVWQVRGRTVPGAAPDPAVWRRCPSGDGPAGTSPGGPRMGAHPSRRQAASQTRSAPSRRGLGATGRGGQAVRGTHVRPPIAQRVLGTGIGRHTEGPGQRNAGNVRNSHGKSAVFPGQARPEHVLPRDLAGGFEARLVPRHRCQPPRPATDMCRHSTMDMA